MYEELFKRYDGQLKKVAGAFSRKTQYRIESIEFYQEFAVRLMELVPRYENLPQEEFRKTLNRSLHNLGVDVLKRSSKTIPVDPQSTTIINTVMVPSYKHFYKQAVMQILEDTRDKEIFGWLVENIEAVEEVRAVKNVSLKRQRRATIADVVEAIANEFQLNRMAARNHFNKIRASIDRVISEGLCY